MATYNLNFKAIFLSETHYLFSDIQDNLRTIGLIDLSVTVNQIYLNERQMDDIGHTLLVTTEDIFCNEKNTKKSQVKLYTFDIRRIIVSITY